MTEVSDEMVQIAGNVLMQYGVNAPEQVIFQAARAAVSAALAVAPKPRMKALAIAKIEEIRHQVRINVGIAKRHHPEGPIVDGRRVDGILHSQEILAGHVMDRLDELVRIMEDGQ